MSVGDARTAGSRAAGDTAALDDLEFHWGDAYDIAVTGAQWTARRRDGKGVPLADPAPGGLRERIAADYAADPVPRDQGPAVNGQRRGVSGAGEDRALDALTLAWGGEYDEIWVYDGQWGAHREGAWDDEVLTAGTPAGLNAAIRADQASRGLP